MHPCLSELKKIPGISFINNGMLVETENREFIDDLDTIPYPARHLMKMDKYRTLELRKRKITSLITSRGCPFDCSFCSSTRFTGLRWRTRTPKSILDETEHIINKYDFNSIAFLDDNFTLKPSRTIEISDLILERKLDLYWWCFSRCDTIVKNERMVAKMAESGCKYIFLGIESPDQIALDNMNKGISSKTAENAVSMLKKHGIDAMASYIIGQPGDTKESIADTVNFAKKLKTGGVQFSVMTPFPGTRLLENMQDKITDTNWENYDCMHLVYRHDNFDAEAMQKQLKKAYFKNYFTFSRIIKGIFSTLIGKGIKLSSIKRLFKVFKK
jgi:anaerobic magnesium-protoporphyrin IX monomethyl ester cyclase